MRRSARPPWPSSVTPTTASRRSATLSASRATPTTSTPASETVLYCGAVPRLFSALHVRIYDLIPGYLKFGAYLAGFNTPDDSRRADTQLNASFIFTATGSPQRTRAAGQPRFRSVGHTTGMPRTNVAMEG